MQSVFKGIYNTVSNYQNEISSSVFQVTGALALNSALTRVDLPVGYANDEGIYTVFDTSLGITWNGSYLPAGSALTNKLVINPPSGYAVIAEPYIDASGKRVKIGLRKTEETEDSHRLSFDSVLSTAGNTTREGNTITVYDVSTETQTRKLYYSASVMSAGDFEDGIYTGSFYIINGTGSFSKKFRLDYANENSELFKFSISNDSSFAKIVAATPTITVQDTAKLPTLTVNSTSVTEGSAFAVTASFANSSDFNTDSIYYYTIESVSGNVTADDFSDGTMSGSFKVNQSTKTGIFQKQLKFDGSTEGSENFRIYLRPGSYSDVSVADTSITVSDSVKVEAGPYFPGATGATLYSGGLSDLTPFRLNGLCSNVHQITYSAAELTAAGLLANDVICGMRFYLSSPWDSNFDYTNFQIGMQHTANLPSSTTSVTSGYTTVYSELGPIVPNTQAHVSLSTPRINFSNNFTWNGTSNLIIKIAISTPDVQAKSTSAYYYNKASSGNTLYASTSTIGTIYTLSTSIINSLVDFRPQLGLIVAR